MKRKAVTKAEKAHMALIKTMPCVCCYPQLYELGIAKSRGIFVSEAHHITDNSAGRLGNYYTLPLCADHHRGRNGFSGMNRSSWDKSLQNQLDLLHKVCKCLGIETPVYTPKYAQIRQLRELKHGESQSF